MQSSSISPRCIPGNVLDGKMNYNFGMRTSTHFGKSRSRPLDLSILQWNAGGLSQPKRAELQRTLSLFDIDVFTIMEANLTDDLLNFYPFAGYRLYLLPKFRQVASGILVGVKHGLTSNFEVVKDMGVTVDKSEIVSLKVWKNQSLFKIYAAYIPPGSKPDLSILNIGQKTILIGDFNAHSKRWGYQDLNAAGLELEDLLNSSLLELMYNKEDPHTYIHYNGTCGSPDLLCVSSDIGSFTKRKVIEDPGSGHRQTIAFINVPNSQPYVRAHQKISWNFKKANWGKFTDLLDHELLVNKLDFSLNSDKLVHNLNKVILRCAGASIPRGKVKNFKCFWSPELVEHKKKRDRLRRKAELTKRPTDVTSWRKQVGVFRREILDAKRKSFADFISNVNYKEDGLRIYNFVANLQNKTSRPKREPFKVEDKILTSHRDIANAFGNNYYHSQRLGSSARKLSRSLKVKNRELFYRENQDHQINSDDIFGTPFGLNELEVTLSLLKVKKSPGEDHVHGEFLKHLGKVAKRTLLKVFNRIWETGLVPSLWRKATVIPILKKNKDPKLLSSYRPISLTSIMGKTMERLVVNRLNWYLESNNLLAEEQAGFRRNRSTNDQVTLFSQFIKDALDERNILTAVFIDFKSAYDSVWREKLLQKLLKIGITSRMFSWIRSFIGQRTCKVNYGDESSKFYNLQSGLPQGAVSSCTLFNLYINDLITALKSISGINCLLYADDLVIWSQAPRKNARTLIEAKLNEALVVLSEWCNDNNMTVNLEKTATQSFSLTHQRFCPNLSYRNNAVVNTESFTYLGVTFDCKLTFKHHVASISERFSKRLLILKRLAGATWGSARSTINTTYKTFVLPMFTYCCEPLITVSNELFGKLETLQNQALRIITGAVKTTPIDTMLFLTNNRPIKFIIQERAAILFEKLLRLGDAFWQEYQPKTRNLKTQLGFVQKVLAIREEFEFHEKGQHLLKPRNPLELHRVEVILKLTQFVSKEETSAAVLKSVALETIETKYPEKEWLRVFTDGSQFQKHTNIGAGVFSELFAFYAPVGKYGTAFDGEVEAIRIALKQLNGLLYKSKNVVILSDSQAAIQSIGSIDTPLSNEILECQDLIKSLESHHIRVVLQWIPGHCDVYGNERADSLAKKGAALLTCRIKEISFISAKQFIRQFLGSTYQLELHRKMISKYNHLPSVPEKPRREAVATFRLLTGHDCLAAHLCRIGMYAVAACPLCDSGEDMDRHHLPRCKALHGDTETSRYWEARNLLRQ